MAEYIDLDTPLEVYAECGGVCKKQITSLRDLLDINKISYTAADVRPVVHGKWMADGVGYHWTYNCSICGWKDGYPFNERHNFCPNCGADMREES